MIQAVVTRFSCAGIPTIQKRQSDFLREILHNVQSVFFQNISELLSLRLFLTSQFN